MDVDGVLVGDLFVDFVGEQHQIVFSCQRRELLQHVPRVDGAGGIVGVDHNDGTGPGGDFGFDVRHVRPPVVVFVAQVVDGLAAGEGHGCGPQRVVRCGDQHFVAVLQERLQRHGDEFGDPVADEDVLHADLHQALGLVILRDRRAGGKDALGIAVALGSAQVVDHVHHNRFRRLQSERRRVPEVHPQDAVALGLHLLGRVQNRAAELVTNVLEFAGVLHRTHALCFHIRHRPFMWCSPRLPSRRQVWCPTP